MKHCRPLTQIIPMAQSTLDTKLDFMEDLMQEVLEIQARLVRK